MIRTLPFLVLPLAAAEVARQPVIPPPPAVQTVDEARITGRVTPSPWFGAVWEDGLAEVAEYDLTLVFVAMHARDRKHGGAGATVQHDHRDDDLPVGRFVVRPRQPHGAEFAPRPIERNVEFGRSAHDASPNAAALANRPGAPPECKNKGAASRAKCPASHAAISPAKALPV